MSPKTLLAVPDFPRAIEHKFTNQVLSIMSQPRFNEHISIDAPCSVSSAVQQWDYRPLGLLLSYSIAVGVSLLAVLAGVLAARCNGYEVDGFSSSTLLATTRNPELDVLMGGFQVDAEPLPEKVMGSRLRLGVAFTVVKLGE